MPILPFIEPDWPAPANVVAYCTTRRGGVSRAPHGALNLASHVGDSSAAVAENRERLRLALGCEMQLSWLDQVHGVAAVEAQLQSCPAADAQWSRQPGLACAVMTADCLPVLFCAQSGDVVAAAHAGWRGLQAGVLEATIAAMATPVTQLLAWLGPAIGPDAFEVGPEVYAAFMQSDTAEPAATRACFRPSPDRPEHWYADLYALARVRLARAGVTRIYGGDCCTYHDSARFFSYRRDGETGRMASLVALRPGD
ncbi:peptidoglycan editing factor PgeF [Candidatus Marimicrobium litorale]|uniref:peptidoglycan editing factor PgeF n=1 Tax=Candidatus Marimicrobium litorale TaxID=2518991 RepID=UPI00242F80DE|nr:peptidoglycan editing factor PgeF [Candidatus Marimicrobium litorale]